MNLPTTSRFRRHLGLTAILSAFMLLCGNTFAISLSQLQNDIDYVINNSNSNVQWSVKVENNDGNGDFYSKNPTTMRRPASNTKLFTVAAAFNKYGSSHVWNGYALGSSSSYSPVHYILANSNNSYADSLWSHVGGESACLNEIAQITSTSGMQINDGSGLNYGNRFNCEQTIDVVRHMQNTYGWSAYSSHLARACVQGTLASRLCGGDTYGRVYAKTGTLTNGQTLSLSGFLDNKYDGKRYYFSIYCNSVPSYAQSDTRSRMDTIVGYLGQSGMPSVGGVEVIVDNDTSAFIQSGNWWASSSTSGYYGSNYRVRATGSVSDAAYWRGTIPSDGNYEVFVRYTSGSNRATSAPYIVYHTGGSTTKYVNQQSGGGSWQSLGVFNLYQGSTANRVALSCWTGSGTYVIADAVKFVKQ
ncbi:MAG: D-alanyl-D-alanine carboxypeptidase [Sumerlaeia bacterium]